MLPDHLCEVCRQRMDAVLWAVGRHPGCRSSPPISDRAEAQLIAALTHHLGAAEVGSNKKEITAMTHLDPTDRGDKTS